VKEIDPNKRSKTLITFKGQVRREKLKGKPKGNQVEQRPYKSQLKNKMVKKNLNDKNMLNKERENIRRKNLGVTHENDPKQKKKRLNKQITFIHAFQRMDDKKIS